MRSPVNCVVPPPGRGCLDDARGDEPPLADDQLDAGLGEEAAVVVDHGGNDGGGAGGHGRHVGLHGAGADAEELRSRGPNAPTPAARDERLGGDAGDVDAGAADEAALDHGDRAVRPRAMSMARVLPALPPPMISSS